MRHDAEFAFQNYIQSEMELFKITSLLSVVTSFVNLNANCLCLSSDPVSLSRHQDLY